MYRRQFPVINVFDLPHRLNWITYGEEIIAYVSRANLIARGEMEGRLDAESNSLHAIFAINTFYLLRI
jgi:hypothetical protein